MARFAGLRRAGATVRNARGQPKWLLYTGVGIVVFFVILAVFAPLIAPYGFDQVSSGGVRFPKQGDPSSASSGAPERRSRWWCWRSPSRS
jgi:peptide/nickel transport system permease protein